MLFWSVSKYTILQAPHSGTRNNYTVSAKSLAALVSGLRDSLLCFFSYAAFWKTESDASAFVSAQLLCGQQVSGCCGGFVNVNGACIAARRAVAMVAVAKVSLLVFLSLSVGQ